VADLGIAHDSLWKTDCLAMGDEFRVGVLSDELSVKGHPSILNGVKRGLAPNSKSIKDDENGFLMAHRQRLLWVSSV
jgi:hypothetical protein